MGILRRKLQEREEGNQKKQTLSLSLISVASVSAHFGFLLETLTRRKQDTSARKNIFEVPEKKGVTKRRLADFVQQDFGLKQEKNLSARARSTLLNCKNAASLFFFIKANI